MRRVLLLLLLAGCVRDKLAKVVVPSPDQLPFIPQPVRITTPEDVTSETTQHLTIAADICQGTFADCGYQLRGGTTYLDWTDCGTALAPRSNDAGGKDAQDPACVVGTNFVFTLEPGGEVENTVNTLQIRTRNLAGAVSSEDSVDITHDVSTPPAPPNVRVTATRNGVQVTWDEVTTTDVAGYRVFYGGTPDVLEGTGAFEGDSPVFANDDETTLRLNNLPIGVPVYVGVTAFDELGHESPLTVVDPGVQSAVPSELPLRHLRTIPADDAFTPRAIAVRGDLVIVVGNDSTPNTIVRSYDLAALTSATGTVAPLDEVPLSNEVKRPSLCAFLDGKGASTLAAAPKSARFFGRYVFVSTGMGDTFALDVADPSNLRQAWHDDKQPAAVEDQGCGSSVDIHWPFVVIADGVPPGPNDARDSTTVSRVRLLRFGETSTAAPQLRAIHACGCTACTNDNIVNGTCDESTCSSNLRLNTEFAAAASPIRYASTARFYTDDDNFPAYTNLQLLVQEGDRGTELYDNITFGSCGNGGNNSQRVGLQPSQTAAVTSFGFTADLQSPQWLVLKGPYANVEGGASETGALTVFEGYEQILEFSSITPAPLPRPSLAMTSAGRYIFIGSEGGRGIDMLELGPVSTASISGEARFVGLYQTRGDVRGLAVAGPYLLAADTIDGLIVTALYDGSTLGNVRTNAFASSGDVRVSGGRMLATAPDPANTATSPRIQSLRSLAQGPYAAQAGAGASYCWALDEEAGRIVCTATGSSNSPPLIGQTASLAFTTLNSFGVAWQPNSFFDGDMRALRPVLFGPRVYVSHTNPNDSDSPQLGSLTATSNAFGDAMEYEIGTPVPLAALGVTFVERYPAPALAAEGNALVLESDDRVTRFDITDPDGPTNPVSYAGLRSPVIGISDICGVELSAATGGTRDVYLACYPRSGGTTQSLTVSLGTTSASKAVLSKRGNLAAVGLVGEGVRLVNLDADPPVVGASVGVAVSDRSQLTFNGPFLYGACSFGACELRLLP